MEKELNNKELKGGEKKMSLGNQNVQTCICERCGYEWIPRQIETPINCPKCKSAYWNRPRVRNISKKGE